MDTNGFKVGDNVRTSHGYVGEILRFNEWRYGVMAAIEQPGTTPVVAPVSDLKYDTQTREEPTTVQWVCTCCYVLHVNGDACQCCDPDDLMKLFGDMEVTSGMLDHSDECERETVGECDCETTTFSWSACDGCGSNLGGERHAVTGWIPVQEPAKS
jgi:hypothetical protein